MFLSYHCAKRLAVGEGLEKASEREETRERRGFIVSERLEEVDLKSVVMDGKCLTKGPLEVQSKPALPAVYRVPCLSP